MAEKDKDEGEYTDPIPAPNLTKSPDTVSEPRTEVQVPTASETRLAKESESPSFGTNIEQPVFDTPASEQAATSCVQTESDPSGDTEPLNLSAPLSLQFQPLTKRGRRKNKREGIKFCVNFFCGSFTVYDRGVKSRPSKNGNLHDEVTSVSCFLPLFFSASFVSFLKSCFCRRQIKGEIVGLKIVHIFFSTVLLEDDHLEYKV